MEYTGRRIMKADVDRFNAARDHFRDRLDLRLDTQVQVTSEGSIIDPASVHSCKPNCLLQEYDIDGLSVVPLLAL